MSGIRTHNFRGEIATYCTGSCKSIYHTIMSMTATFEKNQNIKTFQYYDPISLFQTQISHILDKLDV